MAASSVRLKPMYWHLLCHISMVLALPFTALTPLQLDVVSREVIINNSTGIPQVFDSSTEQAIPQGPATDGSGTNFSPPALIWIGFCFGIGIPMAIAGIRGWRLTTGVGVGLPAAVCSWAAFINTVNATGVPDLVLTAVVLSFFFLGFIIGVFDFAALAALATLGICGGFAFGIRIMLLKTNLLFSATPQFSINWILIALFGLLGGVAIAWPKFHRAGILFGSASVGTFLFSLGIDLVMHKQSGMSQGLRLLFDGNQAHLLAILEHPYEPQLSTQILLAVSMGLTPILAYAQHRIFKEPFSRKPRQVSTLLQSPPSGFRESMFVAIPRVAAKLKSRFSL